MFAAANILALNNGNFLHRTFAIYRGMFIVIFLIWLLGWNACSWSSNHINYKRIFKFNHHSSQVSQVILLLPNNVKFI